MIKYTDVICPKCKKVNHVPATRGSIRWKCTHCGSVLSVTEAASAPQEKAFTVRCKGCNVPLTFPESRLGQTSFCPQCHTKLILLPEGAAPAPQPKPAPAEPKFQSAAQSPIASSEKLITITCKGCGVYLHFPESRLGQTSFCPQCHTKLVLLPEGVKAPAAAPKPASPAAQQPAASPKDPFSIFQLPQGAHNPLLQPKAKPAQPVSQPKSAGSVQTLFGTAFQPGAKAPMGQPKPAASAAEPKPQSKPVRTVTVTRGIHSYKGLDGISLKNMFKDSTPVPVLLDGVLQGTLSKNQAVVTFSVDSGAHTLSFNPISAKTPLPAGQDNYSAIFFNETFHVGIEGDPFEKELAVFILNMVRGKGFRDRVFHPNNRHNAVGISLRPDHILIYYDVKTTKGFSQWASGREEEKISYISAGLTPPPKSRQPGGYWSHMEMLIQDV
ncbi:MAG: hypothetical protein IKM31_07780, partial [Oscillospiraceae bacterium]|nr:hypothetical protein [Oscillospiraceae bacterium]